MQMEFVFHTATEI